MTTEMCCSENVRLWYQAGDIWKVSKGLVGGAEEYTSVADRSSQLSPTNNVRPSKTASSSTSPKVLVPLEYTPLRHRSAIERVIAALVGLDPKLDSAPKVWTTFAVAKYYEITRSPLTDYIIRWLRAYPNSFFLEVCPEISLRIADGFENHDLARDAFAILVGEEALESQVRSRTGLGRQYRNVHGRRKEYLPEVFLTRIEYASKALLDRINKEFNDLIGERMAWVDTLPEVLTLSAHLDPELQELASSFKELLKDYVRGTIYKLLCVSFDCVPPLDFHHPGGEDLIRRPSLAKVWGTLKTRERIMSRTFWKALLSFDLFCGTTNLDVRRGWGKGCHNTCPSSEEAREQGLGTYREVYNIEIHDFIRKIENSQNSPMLQTHQPSSTTLEQASVPAQHNHTDQNRTSATPTSRIASLQEAQVESGDVLNFDFEAFLKADDKSAKPIDIQQISRTELPLRTKPNLVPMSDDPLETQIAADEWRRANGTMSELPVSGRFTSSSDTLVDSNDRQEKELLTPFRDWIPDFEEYASLPTFVDGRGLQEYPLHQRDKEKNNLSSAPANLFSLQHFFIEAKAYIKSAAESKLRFTDQKEREEPHEVGITNTLVCLQESEWKYLPLWAGGLDDGTGGVFNDQIPLDDIGFCAPGPEVHTGFTPANSHREPSEFELVNSQYGTDTINTSMANNRSVPDTMDRRRVYAADSIGSSTYEDFDMMTLDSSEKRDTHVIAESTLTSARNPKHHLGIKIDENYADIFGDDDDMLEDDIDISEDDQSTVDGSEKNDDEDYDMVSD